MIDRRALLTAGIALAAFPARSRAALPVPAGGRLGFDVLYRGSRLGMHVLTFDRAGDALTVDVAVELSFHMLGMTLYRYSHHATERWAGDQLVSLQTASDDNGTKYQVTAQRGPAGFVVQPVKAPRYTAPAGALPATHWNRREHDGPWINTQGGKLLRPKVTPGAIEAIPTASKATIRARRYTLTGDAQFDMFYDDRIGWAGLSFQKRGAEVRYVRQGL